MNATKTIDELIREYNQAQTDAFNDYRTWEQAQQARIKMGLPELNYKDSFEGRKIDYSKFEKELGDIIQRDLKLTDKQRGYVMAEAYDRYHSSYGDMFWGAYGLAEWVTKFPKD